MRTLLLILSLLLLAGCSSIDARNNPADNVYKYTRFFVEHRLNDNHNTDAQIAADLRSRGFQASHGPLTMMPDDTQVLVKYDARWTWDFRSYIIDLKITAIHVYSKKVVATGQYHQAGFLIKKPKKMIHLLIDDLYDL